MASEVLNNPDPNRIGLLPDLPQKWRPQSR
jgi:hypothetical protein